MLWEEGGSHPQEEFAQRAISCATLHHHLLQAAAVKITQAVPSTSYKDRITGHICAAAEHALQQLVSHEDCSIQLRWGKAPGLVVSVSVTLCRSDLLLHACRGPASVLSALFAAALDLAEAPVRTANLLLVGWAVDMLLSALVKGGGDRCSGSGRSGRSSACGGGPDLGRRSYSRQGSSHSQFQSMASADLSAFCWEAQQQQQQQQQQLQLQQHRRASLHGGEHLPSWPATPSWPAPHDRSHSGPLHSANLSRHASPSSASRQVTPLVLSRQSSPPTPAHAAVSGNYPLVLPMPADEPVRPANIVASLSYTLLLVIACAWHCLSLLWSLVWGKNVSCPYNTLAAVAATATLAVLGCKAGCVLAAFSGDSVPKWPQELRRRKARVVGDRPRRSSRMTLPDLARWHLKEGSAK